MHRMFNELLTKTPKRSLIVLFMIICSVFAQDAALANSNSPSAGFSYQPNVWQAISVHASLKKYANRRAVHQQIHWYLSHREALGVLTKNASPYIFYIKQEVQSRGMPADIALLPMVESNYNPFGVSNAAAVGLWQMRSGTARGLGVSISSHFDGRRDVIASTHAALDYLQYLHDYFHDWPLALAAYNAGIGTVQKAIQYNKSRGLSTDYWSLPLPQQTKEYLPKLVAISVLLAPNSTYNIPVQKVKNRPFFTSVKLNFHMSLHSIARLANANYNTIKRLNAGFKHTMIHSKSYNLLVPIRSLSGFKIRLAQYMTHIKPQFAHSTQHYTVQRGDSLSTIAEDHKITTLALRESNHLNSDMIRAGQSLTIPTV